LIENFRDNGITWRYLFGIKSFIQMIYVHIIKVHY